MEEVQENFYRKPKKKERHKIYYVHTRLDQEEYDKLQELLKRTGLTRSAILCKLIKESKIVMPPSIDYIKVYKELKHIGININQISAKLNSIGIVDDYALKEEMKYLHNLINEIEKYF